MVSRKKAIVAIAKTVAELTFRPKDDVIRQQLIEQLTREIMNYDAEYRREGTEKEGRADWHLASLTLPHAWTGRGWWGSLFRAGSRV